MRLLTDANISLTVAAHQGNSNFAAVHVVDLDMITASLLSEPITSDQGNG